MPGMKGESGKTPTTSRTGGAYKHSDNTMSDATTENIAGWNSGDGSQATRGGAITNANGGYGKGKSGGGNSDY